MKIIRILGREIYDSRGWPTVQCELYLEHGISVISNVPSGLSKGKYEAFELRDGQERLFGKGVRKAIENIEQIIGPELIGKEPSIIEMDQKMLELDGTPDKSSLGANSILAVSIALYKAQAAIHGMELYEFIANVVSSETVSLPVPFFNLINGGMHAYNNLSIQEFMVVPVGLPNFRAAMELGVTVFHELESIIKKSGKFLGYGDEGGISISGTDTEALDFLMQAIERVKTFGNCAIALDVAASQYYDPNSKLYKWNNTHVDSAYMINYYQDLIKKYPIFSIEDALSDQDLEGWATLTRLLENKVHIVGDDIFATNIYRIAQGKNDNLASAVVIKPNQIGTVTETLYAIKLCKDLGLSTIVSHRSGDTEDSFIADLAVGTSAGNIKAGGCTASENLAKYNRLLRIDDILTFKLF